MMMCANERASHKLMVVDKLEGKIEIIFLRFCLHILGGLPMLDK